MGRSAARKTTRKTTQRSKMTQTRTEMACPTQFFSSLLGITHRHTAYHHPEGNSYIERFRRSLKEEEV
jgi:transposase InsO family protein